ncbi:uncharacterized protein BX664DRAFT_332057 [Halteromyces radiatus]|uniref:uncharacterized protein n=1 Tax=Halteromyces radiatus TaxID=101107 RepID=UPI002220E7A9|nr:uncharacterized protein BX664DRAFT_332057 [Halteromyces radiatus]KAI8089053.1 hypothetical protein BX664DRAFT_332057 [Halteromyces radiatus]
MGSRAFFLTLLRFLLVIVSVGTLVCHAVQIVKLNDNSWFSKKNYSYILYFVGPGVSTLSSLALVFSIICGIRSIRGDRFLGILNLALMIATVVVCTLKSGPVPWQANDEGSEGGPNGFQSSCNGYQDSNSTLYIRCWLSNGAWIGSIVIAVFWLILLLYVFVQRSGDIYDDDEYEVYDFKNGSHQHDIPMAVTSHSPILSPLKQQQQPSPLLPAHPVMVNEYDHAHYDTGYMDYSQQQQAYGYQPQQPYTDHHYQQHYDPYGADGHIHNNGGKGYYVPGLVGVNSSPLTTTATQHTSTTANTNTPGGGSHIDDTTHIMADVGGVGHHSPYPVNKSPPHTPSHQVPHTYE